MKPSTTLAAAAVTMTAAACTLNGIDQFHQARYRVAAQWALATLALLAITAWLIRKGER